VKFFRRLLRLFLPKTDPLPPPLTLFDVLQTVQQAQRTLSVAAYQLSDLELTSKDAAALAGWHGKAEFHLSQLHNALKDALEVQRLELLNNTRPESDQ
jgi:hypothetical protein